MNKFDKYIDEFDEQKCPQCGKCVYLMHNEIQQQD